MSESEGGGGLTMGRRGGGGASRWDVFGEGCVNDRSWLEGEEVAAQEKKKTRRN